MANGTFPKRAAREPLVSITIILLCRGLGRAFLSRSHAQKLTAMLQLLLAVSIAEEPVVANTVEPTRQNVEQKSPDELVRRKGHGFLLIVIAVVSPAEFHLALFDVDKAMIGNGDPVGGWRIAKLNWGTLSRVFRFARIRRCVTSASISFILS